MTGEICLTPDELADFTDARHASKQMRVLTKNGIQFTLTAEGKVKVLRYHAYGERREEPRLEKLRR